MLGGLLIALLAIDSPEMFSSFSPSAEAHRLVFHHHLNLTVSPVEHTASSRRFADCSAGVQDPSRQVCCSAACGLCGGRGCSSRPGGPRQCCMPAILRTGRVCESRADVACILRGSSNYVRGDGVEHRGSSGTVLAAAGGESTQPASLAPMKLHPRLPPVRVPVEHTTSSRRFADCSAGVQDPSRKVCCNAACGLCGGRGCSSRPGGPRQCCMPAILRTGRVCESRADVACILRGSNYIRGDGDGSSGAVLAAAGGDSTPPASTHPTILHPLTPSTKRLESLEQALQSSLSVNESVVGSLPHDDVRTKPLGAKDPSVEPAISQLVLRSARSAAAAQNRTVTVVIPHMGRAGSWGLCQLLRNLLAYEVMQRPGSEVLVTYGSRTAYLGRLEFGAKCFGVKGRVLASLASRVVHYDNSEINADLKTFQRYYATTRARADVVAHLDDDMLPAEELFTAMLATTDPTAYPPVYVGAESLSRTCGPGGYNAPGQPRLILTNFAMHAAKHSHRLLAASVKRLDIIRHTSGNGEDILWFEAAMELGFAPKFVGRCGNAVNPSVCGARPLHWGVPRTAFQHDDGSAEFRMLQGGQFMDSYHMKPSHYPTRASLCRCLRQDLPAWPAEVADAAQALACVKAANTSGLHFTPLTVRHDMLASRGQEAILLGDLTDARSPGTGGPALAGVRLWVAIPLADPVRALVSLDSVAQQVKRYPQPFVVVLFATTNETYKVANTFIATHAAMPNLLNGYNRIAWQLLQDPGVESGPARSRWRLMQHVRTRARPMDVIVHFDGDDELIDGALAEVASRYHNVASGSITPWVVYSRLDGHRASECGRVNVSWTGADFRSTPWRYCHIRTFRVFLIEYFKLDDFTLPDGTWLVKGTDRQLVYRPLELSGGERVQFIDKPLVKYYTSARSSVVTINKLTRTLHINHALTRRPAAPIVLPMHVLLDLRRGSAKNQAVTEVFLMLKRLVLNQLPLYRRVHVHALCNHPLPIASIGRTVADALGDQQAVTELVGPLLQLTTYYEPKATHKRLRGPALKWLVAATIFSLHALDDVIEVSLETLKTGHALHAIDTINKHRWVDGALAVDNGTLPAHGTWKVHPASEIGARFVMCPSAELVGGVRAGGSQPCEYHFLGTVAHHEQGGRFAPLQAHIIR